MRETPLFVLLLCYAAFSSSYSWLCGSVKAPPLAAFQVYATCIPAWYALAVACYLAGAFAVSVLSSLLSAMPRPQSSPRFWPPTRQEALSAVASTMILTSETLMLLAPQSVFAVVAAKAGCLAVPDPNDARPWHQKLRLAAVAIVAVVLASLGKSFRWLALPLFLALLYVVGHRLKLRAVRLAKGVASLKPGFFAAGQVLVIALTLCVAGVFHGASTAMAPNFGDARLWFVALASMCCGLLGLRITLHRTPESVVFPAYRAASLLCALGASAARGEALRWSGWLAVALALGVVLWASGEGFLRRLAERATFAMLRGLRWLRIGFGVVAIELGAARRELSAGSL